MKSGRISRILTLGLSLATLASFADEWWVYPDRISIAEPKGRELEVRVTKKSRLPDDFVPGNLVVLGPEIIRTKKEVRVRKELLGPLKRLRLAAEKDDIDLVVLSGYRSFERQKKVHEYWVKYEKGDRTAAEKYSARAGHSEHQLGTAVDFSTKEINDAIGPTFHKTNAAKWLRENAADYGFRISYPKGQEKITGYQWESWHWRWWPENSLEK